MNDQSVLRDLAGEYRRAQSPENPQFVRDAFAAVLDSKPALKQQVLAIAGSR